MQIMNENYYNHYIEYCETCNSCMHPNAANGNDDNNNNNGYYGWNDYKMDDDGNANCRYEDVCTNYWSACKDYKADAYQLEDYFECSQFNMGDNIAYLGPHCGDDGKTIGIGVYADGYCNEYVKDLKEVSSYLDMDMTDSSEYLKPFTSENCISCLASVSDRYYLDIFLAFFVYILIVGLLLCSLSFCTRRETTWMTTRMKIIALAMFATQYMTRAPNAISTWEMMGISM